MIIILQQQQARERKSHLQIDYDANQAVLSHHWQDALWNEQQILSTEQRCNARSLLLESVIWYSTFLEIPPLTKLAAHYNLEFYEPEVLVARNFIKSLQSKE